MVFNSVKFLVFFPIVVLAYFIMPNKVKKLFLLVASYYFYMCWIPKYVVLMLFSTISTYLTGFLIDKTESPKKRKISLAINIVVNLGILFVFKYFNFFYDSIKPILDVFNINTDFQSSLLLPVGISFYTFHALGYSIDVYRKTIRHERNFINYALFVSFFPQLVAGPIARAKDLIPQCRENHSFDYDRTIRGLRLILIGMFKKVVIADVVAVYVNQVFNNVQMYTGAALILAVFLFSIQIYCDFSGYTDIALGSAEILGFELMENFKTPYLSTSIGQFWSRWHISLTSWFRDYIYIPLGGNRKGLVRKYINIFIIFCLSGLWHGAAWTFVIWGVLHGLFRICEELIKQFVHPLEFKSHILQKFKDAVKIIFTYCLVCFAWIFFRANTLHDALYVIKNMFSGISFSLLKLNIRDAVNINLLNSGTFFRFYIISVAVSIMALFLMDIYKAYVLHNENVIGMFDKMKRVNRWLIYWSFCVITIFYFIIQHGIFKQTGQFIYFRF